jgi:hypothetical protein
MGAAESSNTSESVTKLANTIQQSTKADTNQVNNLSQSVDFSGCTIKLRGNLNTNSTADIYVSNSQIANAKQDANLQNNVAQTALQQAKSTVGALGVGYASANNAAKQLVDVSNKVQNDLFVSATQFSNTNQSFTCDRSYIDADNLNITFGSKADFLSSQVLKNEQTAKIVNDIKQTVDQKATATVEGLTGLLFMLVLLICAIGYVLFKPLDTKAGKVLMIAIITCTIIGIFIWMWATGKPPLFGEPDKCISSSKTGKGNYDCGDVTNGEIRISKSPLRYSYPIFQIGSANLVQMAIAKVSGVSEATGGVNNGGYNIETLKKLQTQIDSNYDKYTVDLNNIGQTIPNKIPNPLVNPNSENKMYLIPSEYRTDSNSGGKCTPKIIQVVSNSQNANIADCPTEINPSALTSTDETGSGFSQYIANLNVNEWNEYLGISGSMQLSPEEIKRRTNFARFCLCDILNIDLDIYIDSTELVKINNEDNTTKISTGSNQPVKASQFVPDSPPSNISDKIEGGGVVKGQVCVVNNKVNKIKKATLWIGIPIVVFMFLFLFFMIIKGGEKGKKKEEKK